MVLKLVMVISVRGESSDARRTESGRNDVIEGALTDSEGAPQEGIPRLSLLPQPRRTPSASLYPVKVTLGAMVQAHFHNC